MNLTVSRFGTFIDEEVLIIGYKGQMNLTVSRFGTFIDGEVLKIG